MSGIETRNRIVASALVLFNEKGLQNVRLQEIADDVGISVGNLAYHFAGKEEILKKVAQLIVEELDHIFVKWNKFPGLIDFDNQLSRLYYLIERHSFYFLDVLDIQRSYPRVHEEQKALINSFIEQLYLWLCNQLSNDMLKDIESTKYRKLAEIIWLLSSFWVVQKKVLDAENSERGFKEAVWMQIEPFLSDKGRSEFDALIYPGLLT